MKEELGTIRDQLSILQETLQSLNPNSQPMNNEQGKFLPYFRQILFKSDYRGIRAGMAQFSLMWQGSLDIAHSQLKET